MANYDMSKLVTNLVVVTHFNFRIFKFFEYFFL